METGEPQELTKEQLEKKENERFYKYLILSSLFPLIGFYFSNTCEKKLARVGAQIGGGISCILYGVYMVIVSMSLTAVSYRLAHDHHTGYPEDADTYASSQTDSTYYFTVGLPGWIAIFLGVWVIHTSLGNLYRDTGKRIVSIMEMDKEPIKRCFLPIIGVLISSALYGESRTKFLTGAIGSSCMSIALAPIMFIIGANSPKNLFLCTWLFLIFAIVGGLGLSMFWWRLRILLLSFQQNREFSYTNDSGEADRRDRVVIETQLGNQRSPIASLQIEDDITKLIDNAQAPSENEVYVPPAPSSHVAIDIYRAQEDDEMSFQNGDLIGIEKDYGDGWALGQNISKNRLRGVFPLALVTAIVTGPTQNVSRKKTSFLPRTISMKVKLSK